MAVVIPLATLPTRDDTFLEPGHDIRDDLANAMARVHNSFICHFNSIYDHAEKEYVKNDLGNFLMYLDAFYLVVLHHSEAEERFMFPLLLPRMPDIQRNIDQHVAVHDMLAELKTLIDEARKDKSTYSGRRLREIMDKHAAVFHQHLFDEIPTLDPTALKATVSAEELLPHLREEFEWTVSNVTAPILFPFISGGRDSTKEDMKEKLPGLANAYKGAWKYCPYDPVTNQKQTLNA